MTEDKKLLKTKKAKQELLLAKQEKERKQQLLSPFEIRVMPQKFIGAQVIKSKGKGRKVAKILLVIILILVFFGAIVYGAYQLYKTLNQPIITTITNQPITTPVIENANSNPEQNVDVNTPIKQQESTQPEVTVPVSTPTTPETSTTPKTPTTPATLSFSVDTDSDGLTDTEEDLYGTEVRKPDTDGDGFTDGQEFINLYSPFVSGPISIEEMISINKTVNTSLNYSILNPARWLAISDQQGKDEYSFTSLTGEIFYLTALSNPDQLSLSEWLIINQPNVNPNTVSEYTTKKGLKGIKTSNGLVYFINIPTQSKVYRFTYNPNTIKRLNFMSTFQMMINSLTIL